MSFLKSGMLVEICSINENSGKAVGIFVPNVSMIKNKWIINNINCRSLVLFDTIGVIIDDFDNDYWSKDCKVVLLNNKLCRVFSGNLRLLNE